MCNQSKITNDAKQRPRTRRSPYVSTFFKECWCFDIYLFNYFNIFFMMQKVINHLSSYWGWYGFFGYLILMYVVYKGAASEDEPHNTGDELTIDDLID